jgi:hypothetical protein
VFQQKVSTKGGKIRRRKEEKGEERQSGQGGSGLGGRGRMVAWDSQVNCERARPPASVVKRWVRERPAMVSRRASSKRGQAKRRWGNVVRRSGVCRERVVGEERGESG